MRAFTLTVLLLGAATLTPVAARAQAPGGPGDPPEPPAAEAAPDAPVSAEPTAAPGDPSPNAPLPPLPPIAPLTVGGGPPLTLEDVVDSVRRHYPPLVAERQAVRAAEATRVVAEGGFDLQLDAEGKVVTGYYDYFTAEAQLRQPTPLWGLTVFGGWRIGRGFGPEGLDEDPPSYLGERSVPGYYGELETLSGGEVFIGGRLPLWRGGPIDARRAATRTADLGLRAARAGFTEKRLEIEREAAFAYWKWVSAGVKYRITLELLALAEERQDQIARRVARGGLPAIENLENRRAVLTRRQSLVDARRELEAAAIKLSLYVRRDDGRPRLPRPEELPTQVPEPAFFELPEMRDAVDTALARRPESARVAALVGRREVVVELANNRAAPQIDLTVVGSQDLGSGQADQDKRLGDFVLSGSLVFSTPLQRRALTGAADRAGASLLATQARARFVQQQVVADVLDARSAVNAARDRVEAAEPGADISRAVARAERRRFELGATDLFTVNLRERAAASAEAKRAEARGLAHAAFAAWRTALGLGVIDDEALDGE